jgi:hypothetical protein
VNLVLTSSESRGSGHGGIWFVPRNFLKRVKLRLPS